MVTKESVAFVDSDVAAHFTDSLVQYASEYEDLDLTRTGGVGGQARCFISSVRLIAAQNLAWMVSFHNKDNTAPGTDSVIGHTYNQNTMIDFWPFATTDGYILGASAYVYSVTGLKIPYRDDENAGQLHIALHNRSTTTKIAATGYVQVRVGVIGAA